MEGLPALRRHYAQSVCGGLIHADRLIDAYAKVAREDFLLPPPWGVIINLPGRRGQVLEYGCPEAGKFCRRLLRDDAEADDRRRRGRRVRLHRWQNGKAQEGSAAYGPQKAPETIPRCPGAPVSDC